MVWIKKIILEKYVLCWTNLMLKKTWSLTKIRKLKLYNLGKEVDISFVLFNTKTKMIDQDTDKYYVTKKRSKIGI